MFDLKTVQPVQVDDCPQAIKNVLEQVEECFDAPRATEISFLLRRLYVFSLLSGKTPTIAFPIYATQVGGFINFLKFCSEKGTLQMQFPVPPMSGEDFKIAFEMVCEAEGEAVFCPALNNAMTVDIIEEMLKTVFSDEDPAH